MKLYDSIDILKSKYTLYGEYQFDLINNKFGEVKPDIKLKLPHGLSMCDLVGKITMNSGLLNESYEQSGYVDGLLHDIGRFEQFLLSGTLKDVESIPYTAHNDHGQYGKYLLLKNNKEMLRHFLVDNRLYDRIITEVVGEHTSISNPNYKIGIEELTNLFQNYSLEEILRSNNEDIINKLIALKIKLVDEEDSLEIHQNIVNGLWKPALGYEEKYYATDKAWDLFTNFEEINMNKLKQDKQWSCNSGFLLRYGLMMRKMNFVGTLKSILEDGIIDKIYTNQMNNVSNDNNEIMTDVSSFDPRFKQAYEFTKLAIQALIETSADGKIITDASREEAKELTKSRFYR